MVSYAWCIYADCIFHTEMKDEDRDKDDAVIEEGWSQTRRYKKAEDSYHFVHF
jgi:hypothetical protein